MSIMNHKFISRCEVLSVIVPYYFGLCILWFLITITWIYLVYFRFKRHALYLQKVMLLFPFCKFCEVLVNGLFLNACPWVTDYGESSSEKYIEMARITVVTITNTIFLALFYLMSKGWNTTLFFITRNQATYLTMIMGGVYLAYSAYYLSIGFNVISELMGVKHIINANFILDCVNSIVLSIMFNKYEKYYSMLEVTE